MRTLSDWLVAAVLSAQPLATDRIEITLSLVPEVKATTIASLSKVLRVIPSTRISAVVLPSQASTMTAKVLVGEQVKWANEAAVFAAFELAGVSQVKISRPGK